MDNLSYRYLVALIEEHGRDAAPRGLAVKEFYNHTVKFFAGEMVRRGEINYRLGFMEGLQLIAGVFDKPALKWAAPNAAHDLFSVQSAYGPRVMGQVQRVIDALHEDPQTRRAVITIAQPSEGGTRELPCTLSCQFQLRGHHLDTTVTMRSSDAVYGIPYDVMQFGMLAQAVSRCLRLHGKLGITANALTFQLANAHIYTTTAHHKPLDRPVFKFMLAGNIPVLWGDLMQWAANRVNFPAKHWAGGVPDGVHVMRGE